MKKIILLSIISLNFLLAENKLNNDCEKIYNECIKNYKVLKDFKYYKQLKKCKEKRNYCILKTIK